MPKILSQSGISLADVYNIEGSVAGIEELVSHDVNLVHEMGATIFSERLSQTVAVDVTAALLQDVAIAVPLLAFTSQPIVRIHSIFVFVSTTSRLTDLSISIENDLAVESGIPIWVWDGTNETTMRILTGGAPAVVIALDSNPAYTFLPNLLLGTSQPERTPNLTMRGSTSSFGAGTVTVTVHSQLSFPNLAGLSSKGLPVPSW